MEFGKFEVDPVAEVEGIWKELGEGGRIKVARANNPKFKEVFRRLSEPYQEAIRARILDEETSTKLVVQAMAEAILISWEGMTDNGKELKPTRENKIKILTEFPSFREMVAEIAENHARFKIKASENILGNSSADSNGTSESAATKTSSKT